MRITQSMIYRGGLEQLNGQRNRLARVQEQAASGLRLNRPSDDPVDYQTMLVLKDSLSQTGRFLRTIDSSRTRFGSSEEAISEAANAIDQAKVLAVSARNSTNDDPTSVAIMRGQAESLFDQVLSLANSRSVTGEYLFSGLATDTQAFAQTGTFVSGSPPPSVAFGGDTNAISVEIDRDVFVEVSRVGSEVFQGSIDVFAALTGLWEGIDSGNDAQIGNAIDELDQAFQQLNLERQKVGNAERQANDFEARLTLQRDDVTTRISNLEDADVYEVYSDLASQEVALQASLQVTSRLMSPTLLDFL